MRSTSWAAIFASVLALFVAGCGASVPIYNLSDAPFVSKSSPPPNLDDVSKAIQRAGETRGWKMRQAKPGQIIGTFAIRTHIAIVEVNYSIKSFSIVYRDSVNVSYDGQNIHPEYNKWVGDLEKMIRVELSNL